MARISGEDGGGKECKTGIDERKEKRKTVN